MSALLTAIAAQKRRFDPDAADYFSRITLAGSSITDANKSAVNAFIVGCKTDGIWGAIKASCLLAGPNSLAGALVPLVGTAPTNLNFVAGDYSRTVGLTTDATGKYIATNYSYAVGMQDNAHMAIWSETVMNSGIMGNQRGATGSSTLFVSGQNRAQNSGLFTGVAPLPGFYGHSRETPGSIKYRANNTDYIFSQSSQTPNTDGLNLFRFALDTFSSSGSASFYSIGESLDLALLDARLTTYMATLS
jgi:hypothetical protein